MAHAVFYQRSGSLWSASVLPCTLHVFPIPQGLSPPAQGCEERATLGVECRGRSNPERVAAPAFRRSERNAATTLSGLARNSGPFPRVARPSQPWALGRNPFGILPRVTDSKDACKGLRLAGAFGWQAQARYRTRFVRTPCSLTLETWSLAAAVVPARSVAAVVLKCHLRSS